MTLIVTKNGLAGVNMEHAWGDGVAVLRYLKDVYKDSTEKPFFHPDSLPEVSHIESLIKSWGEYFIVILLIFLFLKLNNIKKLFKKCD